LEKSLNGGNENKNLREYLEHGLSTLNFRLRDQNGLLYNVRYRIASNEFELLNVKINNSGID